MESRQGFLKVEDFAMSLGLRFYNYFKYFKHSFHHRAKFFGWGRGLIVDTQSTF